MTTNPPDTPEDMAAAVSEAVDAYNAYIAEQEAAEAEAEAKRQAEEAARLAEEEKERKTVQGEIFTLVFPMPLPQLTATRDYLKHGTPATLLEPDPTAPRTREADAEVLNGQAARITQLERELQQAKSDKGRAEGAEQRVKAQLDEAQALQSSAELERAIAIAERDTAVAERDDLRSQLETAGVTSRMLDHLEAALAGGRPVMLDQFIGPFKDAAQANAVNEIVAAIINRNSEDEDSELLQGDQLVFMLDRAEHCMQHHNGVPGHLKFLPPDRDESTATTPPSPPYEGEAEEGPPIADDHPVEGQTKKPRKRTIRRAAARAVETVKDAAAH